MQIRTIQNLAAYMLRECGITFSRYYSKIVAKEATKPTPKFTDYGDGQGNFE